MLIIDIWVTTNSFYPDYQGWISKIVSVLMYIKICYSRQTKSISWKHADLPLTKSVIMKLLNLCILCMINMLKSTLKLACWTLGSELTLQLMPENGFGCSSCHVTPSQVKSNCVIFVYFKECGLNQRCKVIEH